MKGKDIIWVQAKTGGLGMYLMGRTFFSEQLRREEKNYLTIPEILRGWIHEAMKREGYEIKEPEQKSKRDK